MFEPERRGVSVAGLIDVTDRARQPTLNVVDVSWDGWCTLHPESCPSLVASEILARVHLVMMMGSHVIFKLVLTLTFSLHLKLLPVHTRLNLV